VAGRRQRKDDLVGHRDEKIDGVASSGIGQRFDRSVGIEDRVGVPDDGAGVPGVEAGSEPVGRRGHDAPALSTEGPDDGHGATSTGVSDENGGHGSPPRQGR